MRFESWIGALEARHLADLTFPEVSRALRALSSTYVERRGRLGQGAALNGAGKRAAFALFYGPLHFLTIDHIIRELPNATRPGASLVDLGCGTGAAGAAWACACERPPDVLGVDKNAWALGEAAWTYKQFGVRGRTCHDDVIRAALPKSPAGIVAAFTLNELDDASRGAAFERLVERRRNGDRVLIVEPLARGVAPWWNALAARARAGGGRADEWRFRAELPAIVSKLDRAAGLDHREITARSIWL